MSKGKRRKQGKNAHVNRYAGQSKAPSIPGDIGVKHSQNSSENDFSFGDGFRPRYSGRRVISGGDKNKIDESFRALRRARIPDLRRPLEDKYDIMGVRFVKEGYDGGIPVDVAEQIADQIQSDVQESIGLERYFDVQVKCICSKEPREPFVRIERGVVSWPELEDRRYGPCDVSSYIRLYVSKAVRQQLSKK